MTSECFAVRPTDLKKNIALCCAQTTLFCPRVFKCFVDVVVYVKEKKKHVWVTNRPRPYVCMIYGQSIIILWWLEHLWFIWWRFTHFLPTASCCVIECLKQDTFNGPFFSFSENPTIEFTPCEWLEGIMNYHELEMKLFKFPLDSWALFAAWLSR